MATRDLFTLDSLINTLNECGMGEDAPATQTVFAELATAHNQPARHYHDQTHINACLNQLLEYQSLAARPAEIALALWFHDAIYDTRRNDNEARSAAWAVAFLTSAGANTALTGRVEHMVLATQTHQAENADARLMVDIDLGILGAPEAAFDRYDADIRREYGWVEEASYRTGRARVLRAFLDRNRIFATEAVHGALETQARHNLQRAIARLEDPH